MIQALARAQSWEGTFLLPSATKAAMLGPCEEAFF
jgi:hypothetical protein